MSGPGAEYTPFSSLNNVVVVADVVDGLKQHAHEEAVRMVGLKLLLIWVKLQEI